MRTFLLLAFALLMSTGLLAQSHGLTYQAVILDSEGNITEIPGYDIPGGNYLPNKPVDLRFTILNEFGGIDYQEEHATTTDLYGMISVIIGDGVMTGESPDVFMEISWDGTPKDLRVEVSIAAPNGTGSFEFFSLEKLVFVPYAYHRNITATGTMDIDGATTLNSTLEVFGVTDLNAALNVNNGSPTYLSGDLTVDGETNLNNGLNVNNGSPTYLSGTLTVDQCLFLHDCLVVDGTTDLNNGLDVNNNTPTNLTGTLNVNGASTLNSTLDVDGATTLNTTLDVDGSTTLNSYLDVDGGTTLNSTLDVDGATTLNGLLDVDGPTTLNLTLDVDGAATLNNTLDVDGGTTLNSTLDVDGASLIHNTLGVEGQTTITANLPGGQDDYNAYPLRVQGSTHGIAVKVNGVEPNKNTNLITFFDGDGTVLGCVEGQTATDVLTDPEYIYTNAGLIATSVLAAGDLVAASSSSTVCAGLGACVTAPVPSLIVAAAVGLTLAIGEIAAYNAFAFTNLGVAYQSGGADYAEWLERADPTEVMSYGDVVGVTGGRISKRATSAEQYMVISHKPAVLGNMPQPGMEQFHEKVGFMGQLPVRVHGPVNVGDYIVASGAGDGFGRAVAPDGLSLSDQKRIVGVAWSASQNPVAGMVNVAIGLPNTSLVTQLNKQQQEIDQLRREMNELRAMVTGQGAPSPKTTQPPAVQEVAPVVTGEITASAEELHPEITREHVEAAFDLLKTQMLEQGVDPATNPHYKALFADPATKEALIARVLDMAAEARAKGVAMDKRFGYR